MRNFLDKTVKLYKKVIRKVKSEWHVIVLKAKRLFNSSNNSSRNHASRRYEPEDKNFFGRAYDWFTSQSQPVMIGLAAGVAVVIAVPIILACTLGGSGSEKKTVEADTTNTYTTIDTEFAAVEPEPTPIPITPETVDPSTVNFTVGQSGEIVSFIQERLMELGYIDYDISNNDYDEFTAQAVSIFKRTNGLEENGTMDPETFTIMFSDDALSYQMTQGTTGEDVEQMQSRLYELGYIESVTGYFGTDTQAAVERFQELNGLSVDGMVGTQTMEMLYSEDVKLNYLSFGASGDQVEKFQNRLKKLGYLTTEVDGKMGGDTVNAIKRFQERNGLIADGYLGPTTKNQLMSSEAVPNALTIGTSGSDVTNIQERLKELKYIKKVTGYYGSDTEAAVKAFQKRNGLSQDGKVGKATMTKLFSDSAKKAASSTPPKNNNSSSGSSSSSGGNKEPSTTVVANGANVQSLIAVAKSKLGTKYVRGGKGPNKFDCSGFVYWCLNQIGVKQGYMTSATWAKCNKYPKVTSLDAVQAGDIICFKGHVGIAIGNGEMIDASSSKGMVRTTSLNQNYWKKYFICAYRVL